MVCSTDFISFICDVLAPLGEVRSRKMMGDYVIYVNDKCVITACDNLAYAKKLPCVAKSHPQNPRENKRRDYPSLLLKS